MKQELEKLPDDEEKIKLKINKMLLQSKGFAVFFVTDTGDVQHATWFSGLNTAEQIGIMTVASNKCDRFLDACMGDDVDFQQDSDDIDEDDIIPPTE